MPEDRLPRRFSAAAGEPIGVVRLVTATAGGSSSALDAAAEAEDEDADAEESNAEEEGDDALLHLTRRGYAPDEAAAALAECGGDAPAALHCLFGALLRAAAPACADWPLAPGGAAATAEDAEAWADECVALGAILGDDARIDADGASAVLDVRCEGPGGAEVVLRLEVAPPSGGAYPRAPPLLALHAPPPWRAPRTLLCRVTARLAAEAAAAAERGEPCAHQLVCALPDALAAALAEPAVEAMAGAAPDAVLTRRGSAPSAAAAAAPGAAAASKPRRDGGGRGGNDGTQRGSRRSAADIARESAALATALASYEGAKSGPAAAMRASRARLPAAESRQAVVTAVAANRVVVLSGETGCGKSTQVPQFLLEAAAAAGSGGACSIVVTQPRRISAIGLAERVAAERCERCGDVVGYAVRLEARRSERTRLLFCTTGILLRRLLNDPELDDVSHVVLDEVHERSLESDLLLLLLRVLLQRRTTLRVVLMSATADSGLFARYFEQAFAVSAPPRRLPRGGAEDAAPGTVGQIHIPGFTHPVADYYLEDVLERTGVLVGRGSRYARKRKPAAGLVDTETGEEVPAVWQDAADAVDDDDDSTAAAASGDKKDAPALAGKAATKASDAEEEAPPGPVPDSWDDAPEVSTSKLQRAPSATSVAAKAQGTDAAGPAAMARAASDTATRLRRDAEALADRELAKYSEGTRRSIGNVDETQINYELIEQLIAYILTTEADQGPHALVAPPLGGGPPPVLGKSPGAVLVFLPGVAEIGKLQRRLERSRLLLPGDVGPLWVLPLHGSLSSADQRRVFETPPAGVRKVVLATNVAETSVTIDDVRHVIDTGRAKEMRFDAARGLSRLEEDWTSGAAGRQRRGRAGRTTPGAAYRLYSRRTAAGLPPQQAPEMLRVPLEALCLRVKALVTAPVADTLALALTPPPAPAVAAALAQLRGLRALDAAEALTPLGQCLVRMPVDARLGKMLIYGAMLRCLDPVLTVAGALSGRGLFVTPREAEARAAADAARSALGAVAGKSDHLAAARAYDGWVAACASGRGAERAYIEANSLSWQALDGVRAAREDYAAVLAELGFVPRAYVDAVRGRSSAAADAARAAMDAHAGSARVVKAALCAGLYPNVLRVAHPESRFAPTAGGTVVKDAAPAAVKFFAREAGRVFLHPASVNFGVGAFESPWLVYSEALENATSKRVYIRECTMVPAYALLLFGGDVDVRHERGTLALDGWAEFEAPARIAVLVRELRAGVDRLLAAKVADPALDIAASPAVTALLQLVRSDGF